VASQVFLGLSALLWLPYGLLCLFQPSFLGGAAGVVATTPTGTIELRAMYGGLQVAIGALCALGSFSVAWRSHALVALAFLATGLGLSRLLGVLAGGGLSSYTTIALAIEFTSAGLALVLARKSGAWAAA
jgi:Domain of unknown function (DUF4345)